MSKKKPTSKDTGDLRGKAEESFSGTAAHRAPPRPDEDSSRLVHELQIHQIELEMQNQQLHQSKNDLENAVARYSDLYDFAPVGYFTLDGNGTIHSVNFSGANLLRTERSRLIGRQFREFVAREDYLVFSAFLEKVHTNHGKYNCEVTLTREDSSSLFAHLEAAYSSDDQECRIALSDFTGRKRASDALKEREEWLNCIFNATNEVIIIYDAVTRTIIDVNERIFEVLGYSRNEVLSLKVGNLSSNVEPYTGKFAEAMMRAAATEGPLQLEWQFRRKDGSLSWTTTSLKTASIGGKDFIIAVVRENNARKHAEDALANSEERYRRLFEVESDAILMVDQESGRFMDANSAALKMYGYTIEEILQLRHRDVSAEPDQTGQAVGNHLTEVPIRWHRKKDGTIFPVEIAGSYFEYQGHRVHVAAIRDITRRKWQEDELRQALEATETANITMQRLLNVIAHEFRTPLGLLTGCTDILDRYWDNLTPEKRFEQNEHIRSAAHQISNLVNSVISFNQQTGARCNHPPKLVDIAETCRSIAAGIATVWSTGQKLDVTIVEDCGTAMLDRNLFRQILENLLTNAFRYTPSDGAVTLRVLRENDRLVVEIIDTGIGIPEEDQMQIFDAFYRGNNVEGRRGLGLGLSIVSDALSRMGGNITVVSRPHEGTTMHVEIPVESLS